MHGVQPTESVAALRRRHLCFGWSALLLFAGLGVALEAMHGFKVAWYLDVANETRRLLWRLGHAHGVLLALVHIAFASTVNQLGSCPRLASPALIGAGIAMSGGFLLGGIDIHGGDPGLGIILLPLGAALLLLGLASTTWTIVKSPRA
jgi:hypothetical protein